MRRAVRLLVRVEAWGEVWRPGTVLQVESDRDSSVQVVFNTEDGPCVGTLVNCEVEEV
jgi:hypothetical protein